MPALSLFTSSSAKQKQRTQFGLKSVKELGETILLSGDIYGETVCVENESDENQNLAGDDDSNLLHRLTLS
jgi:hypothetical protein